MLSSAVQSLVELASHVEGQEGSDSKVRLLVELPLASASKSNVPTGQIILGFVGGSTSMRLFKAMVTFTVPSSTKRPLTWFPESLSLGSSSLSV